MATIYCKSKSCGDYLVAIHQRDVMGKPTDVVIGYKIEHGSAPTTQLLRRDLNANIHHCPKCQELYDTNGHLLDFKRIAEMRQAVIQ
jgi:hypothetical protein